jgi:hypothetical protein
MQQFSCSAEIKYLARKEVQAREKEIERAPARTPSEEESSMMQCSVF